MFLGGGRGGVDGADVGEADAFEPVFEGELGGDEPDVAHFGIATGGDEGVAEGAVDDEGFEDEFAAGA